MDFYNLEFSEFSNFLDLDLFLNSLKKKIFLDILDKSIKNVKYNWALNSLEILMKNIFYNKNKFSEKEFKEIENLRILFKNKSIKDNNTDNQRLLRDNQIKNNPLESSNSVSDARSERIITGGLDTWTSKQTGLSNGKLLM